VGRSSATSATAAVTRTRRSRSLSPAAAGADTDARGGEGGALGAGPALPLEDPADDTEGTLAALAGPRRVRGADAPAGASPEDEVASVDVEPLEPVVSADAIGNADRPDPTPRATASAPTRPTERATLGCTERVEEGPRRRPPTAMQSPNVAT